MACLSGGGVAVTVAAVVAAITSPTPSTCRNATKTTRLARPISFASMLLRVLPARSIVAKSLSVFQLMLYAPALQHDLKVARRELGPFVGVQLSRCAPDRLERISGPGFREQRYCPHEPRNIACTSSTLPNLRPSLLAGLDSNEIKSATHLSSILDDVM